MSQAIAKKQAGMVYLFNRIKNGEQLSGLLKSGEFRHMEFSGYLKNSEALFGLLSKIFYQWNLLRSIKHADFLCRKIHSFDWNLTDMYFCSIKQNQLYRNLNLEEVQKSAPFLGQACVAKKHCCALLAHMSVPKVRIKSVRGLFWATFCPEI